MDKIDGEKPCKNCKYYVALYTKETTRFKTIRGYCVNDKLAARNRRRVFPNDVCCEFWEQTENSVSERNKSIREAIFTMQKQLTQLLELLENEE